MQKIVDASISIIGSGSAGALRNASKVNAIINISTRGYIVNQSKFDYFFGRVTTSNVDNRSAQNLKDITTLGIENESQLIKVFDQAIEKGSTISIKTSEYGTNVMKSVNVGNKGSINVGFFLKKEI